MTKKSITSKVAKDFMDALKIEEKYKNQAHGWIQWKGTNVCMDIHCKCGALCHVDAEFCYCVKCSSCGIVYSCNGHIELIELTEPTSSCIVEAEAH